MNFYLRDETKELLRPETGHAEFPHICRSDLDLPVFSTCLCWTFIRLSSCFVILTILYGVTPELGHFFSLSWLFLAPFTWILRLTCQVDLKTPMQNLNSVPTASGGTVYRKVPRGIPGMPQRWFSTGNKLLNVWWTTASPHFMAAVGSRTLSEVTYNKTSFITGHPMPVSYTHLTLPTTPYV